MARRFVVLVIMAGAVLLVCSALASAAVRTGNEGDNTLMGTRYKDSITGKGDDRTVGKGGNDTYFYADDWGHDTVVDSGGTDTLDFSAVTGGVSVHLCSPVEASDSLSSGSDGGNAVTSASRIENARGSLGNDIIGGCGGKNTLSGGGYEPNSGVGPFPGEGDLLMDVGGFSLFGIPASNDVYLGSKEGSATRHGWRGRRSGPPRLPLQRRRDIWLGRRWQRHAGIVDRGLRQRRGFLRDDVARQPVRGRRFRFFWGVDRY